MNKINGLNEVKLNELKLNEINEMIEMVENEKKSNVLLPPIEKKINFFSDLIQKTILHVQRNKLLNILGTNDIISCINGLNDLNNKIKDITDNLNELNTDVIINNLQIINNDLSILIKTYGTDSLEDLLLICFGNNIITSNQSEMLKYDLLKKFFHPTHYKLVNSKINTVEKSEAQIEENVEKNKNLDCIDISIQVKQFHMKIYGIKVYITNKSFKKNILIYGFLDNIVINFLHNNKYISSIKQHITINALNLQLNNETDKSTFNKYVDSLSLKEYLINNTTEIQNKYIGYVNQNKVFKSKTLQQVTKDFLAGDLFFKRNYLIQLLTMSSSDYDDNNFIAYLLYDLLSNDANGTIDTADQINLIDHFPWTIRQCFKDAMKNTIQYTNELTNFDMNKIPLEQQICLLKADETVKEKAMLKLKEIKAKSEDSGSKARQYLDGLLKIPFQIYRKEAILCVMTDIKSSFLKIIEKEDATNVVSYLQDIPLKNQYTSIEILKYTKSIKMSLNLSKENIITFFTTMSKINLTQSILKINELIDKHAVSDATSAFSKLKYKTKNKDELRQFITDFITSCFTNTVKYNAIIDDLNMLVANQSNVSEAQLKKKGEMNMEIANIERNFTMINKYISNIKNILDTAVYGHDKAKKQIEIIIAQWINGTQSGYCFGFEGGPGIGKTSLAKNGLSNCLKNENGDCRPFAMIQIAGDSNGSTLHGHNYTYVGSTWGSIVQILMDKKCLNPIIFIDEVDKISKTEHGKEIVGILTHLLDSTQNDCFQDKYFNGIELDLSKALFIISYNDPDAIDKILLDRVHRIKFGNLSLEDKLVICNKHLLPEIYKKVGLIDTIEFSNDVITYIIENYTFEVGVRKLKQILFEIVGEINLDILKKHDEIMLLNYTIPIVITIEDIKTKYFKDKSEVRIKRIHDENKVGLINCLYATTSGQSGILSANGRFFPSDKYLELKLTGLLDEMMKESFQISMTLAYNLIDEDTKTLLREKYDGQHKYGIHLHMGDGSINKSGTSAGIAITLLFYSMLTNKKIKNTFAVTGEAGLDGLSNEIGALSQKFLGGMKAGVKSFIFPLENQKDYEKFMEKYKDNEIIKGIDFYPIRNIHEAIDLIFE